MADAILRTCRRCGLPKPLSLFKADGRYLGGHLHHCMECDPHGPNVKAVCRSCGAPKQPGKRCKPCAAARVARYRARFPEKARQIDRRHYERNVEKRRAKSRRWNAENPEALRERNRAHYEARIEEMRQKTRDWSRRNKSAVNAHTAQRKALRIRATVAWADLEAIKSLYDKAAALGMHVDHIVPLRSPLVCGLHCEANMQLLPPAENIRKGNRQWPDMWEPVE